MDTNMTEASKDEVFKLIQKFLKTPPVIIWGSGATIPYGLPGMDDLKKLLKNELKDMNKNANLETELGKIEDQKKMKKIRKLIRDEVEKKDIECLKKSTQKQTKNYFKAIVDMIEIFYGAHPQKIDIITTNYDRVLEYALSGSGYNFTDGFTGRALAKFNSKLFKESKIVNIIKVHGSLNWFSDDSDNMFFLPIDYDIENLNHVMVLPVEENKYREAYKEPYRTLITKSDESIEQAKSFLIVGFGFNDEHLTPKIDNKIKEGTPIVIIVKNATKFCRNKIKTAEKYCLFEEGKKENKTKVTFKENKNQSEKTVLLENNYWELGQFMEVFL